MYVVINSIEITVQQAVDMPLHAGQRSRPVDLCQGNYAALVCFQSHTHTPSVVNRPV